jgi:hypothetical protein
VDALPLADGVEPEAAVGTELGPRLRLQQPAVLLAQVLRDELAKLHLRGETANSEPVQKWADACLVRQSRDYELESTQLDKRKLTREEIKCLEVCRPLSIVQKYACRILKNSRCQFRKGISAAR